MRLVLPPLPEPERLALFLVRQQSFLAHDLANRLVAIQGFARLLAEGGLTDPESRDIASQLADFARRADAAARRLAEMGRLLADPAGPPLSLAQAAREAAEDARLPYHLDGGAGTVAVSPRLLHAVLRELLANIRGHAFLTTGEGFLSVRDEGDGFDDPARLLDKSGFGFLLVRQAASLWRATVTVDSSQRLGTRVEIRFPSTSTEAG